MKSEYKIGDIVKVVDSGQTYNSYIIAAKKLHATRFTDGDLPENGDVAVIRNTSRIWGQRNYILIERLTDKQQFVMAVAGINPCRSPYILENDLFEI